MSDAAGGPKTIRGRYACIGSPCTTDPCLPGTAYAVLSEGEYYYVTLGGRWFSENQTWDDYTPQAGDTVVIAGYPQDRRDVSGKLFHTIEAISLKRAP